VPRPPLIWRGLAAVGDIPVKDLDLFAKLDGYPAGWAGFMDWRASQKDQEKWAMPFSGWLIVWQLTNRPVMKL
jgi:hypothetical protein